MPNNLEQTFLSIEINFKESGDYQAVAVGVAPIFTRYHELKKMIRIRCGYGVSVQNVEPASPSGKYMQ